MSRSIFLPSFVSVLAIAVGGASASAQTAAAPVTPAVAGDDSSAIVVTGIRASLRDALAAKRASSLVVDTISSKDIGALPDVTIADELSRLPGVNSSRDRGNDSQASVRGLGPRLVLGLVNGREVASSEPDRNIRWEIYPSEDVSSVTVFKSQDAGLIAGGVAATIDIRTLRPLDYQGPAITLRAGALYNNGGKDIPGYKGWGERGSVQYVGKAGDDLAFMVGATYQRQKNGKDSFQGWGYNLANTPGDNAPTLNGSQVNAPWGAQTEVDATTEARWSTTAALQWKPGTNWDINADLLYSDVKIDEPQWQQWYGGNGANWGDWGGTIGAPGDPYQSGNYTLAGNSIVAATLNSYSRVTNVIANYSEDKTLLATGLNAKYSNGDTSVKFDGSYSQAVRNNTWQAVESLVYPASVTFNTAAGVTPSVSESSDPALPASQNYTGVGGSSATGLSGPQRLADALGTFQADFSQKVHGGWLAALDAGLRYSHRIKSFTSLTGDSVTVTNPTPSLSEFGVSGFTAPNIVYGDYGSIAQVNLAGATSDPTQYWRVKEDDFEGYVKADFGDAGAPVTGNLGVRFVDVSTESTAYQSYTFWNGTANQTNSTAITVPNHYFRALPSLNLTFNLQPDLLLHAGLARVMSRPPLDELRGAEILSDYTGYHAGSKGNPLLEPFMASQADLSLEYYFRKDGLIAVAGYYKHVDSNIGYMQTSQSITTPLDTAVYTVTEPVNGPGGNIYGTELTLQTPFFFIPGLDHFGIYANAAFVGSDLKEQSPASNPFKAVGIAAFTSESDLWYSGHGIDARVGVKHHSPYTVIFGWNTQQLTRLESETTVGASVSYAINKTISVRVQANNLTNQAARYYFNNDANQIARYEKYGRSYLADVTLKF